VSHTAASQPAVAGWEREQCVPDAVLSAGVLCARVRLTQSFRTAFGSRPRFGTGRWACLDVHSYRPLYALMAGAVMSPEEAGQLAQREVFVGWFDKKVSEPLPLDERVRCETIGRQWRDACRALECWKSLDVVGLGPFCARELVAIVSMSCGSLELIDLTDAAFYGSEDQLSPHGRSAFGVENYNACLRCGLLINIAKLVTKPLSLELRVAGFFWFRLHDVTLLLAGAPSIKFVEMDVDVAVHELDHRLCANAESFSRLIIRRMRLDDRYNILRLHHMRQYPMAELHRCVVDGDFRFMPREVLHIRGYDFSNAFDAQGVQLFDALMAGVAASTVSKLKFERLVFPAQGIASLCRAMASLHLCTLSITQSNEFTAAMLEEFVEALSASSIKTLFFMGIDLPGSIAEAILRASVGHKTLESVTLNFNLMMVDTETSTADSVAGALVDVISANAPTLRTLKLVWAAQPEQHGVSGIGLLRRFPLDLVYAALHVNEYVHLYLPLANHRMHEQTHDCMCRLEGAPDAQLASRVTFHHPTDGFDQYDDWEALEIPTGFLQPV
jgi:hypothetical protein